MWPTSLTYLGEKSMSRTHAAYKRFGLFVVLGLLSMPLPASAQVLSTWGHPVITLGQTPYYATSTGQANYPGSDGFIPGYGYYPGDLPGHYPWLDGPETLFDRRKLAPPPWLGAPESMIPPVEELLPPGAARIVVKIPAEAELWFDGARTSQGGSFRRFVTPSLPKGQSLSYTLQVRWRIKGAELTRAQEVAVGPGSNVTVDFLTVDGWKGRRLPTADGETLPAPRQVTPQGSK
jgi:uncharacterized protein (TIGR03000 family)